MSCRAEYLFANQTTSRCDSLYMHSDPGQQPMEKEITYFLRYLMNQIKGNYGWVTGYQWGTKNATKLGAAVAQEVAVIYNFNVALWDPLVCM